LQFIIAIQVDFKHHKYLYETKGHSLNQVSISFS